MRKIFSGILLSIFAAAAFFAPLKTLAAENTVSIYFFWGKGCPHCEAEWEFFADAKKEYPNIEINDFEIWYSKENREILRKAEEATGVSVSGVPFTVIGEKTFSGFNKSSSPPLFREAIEYYSKNPYQDKIKDVLAAKSPAGADPQIEPDEEKQKLDIPLFGKVDPKKISLPLLAISLGTLDGFNPCSLWVLLFLIAILLEMKDRKKMALIGGVFILTEALSYLFFMTAWLKLIVFIGFIAAIRFAIGGLAVGVGAWNLWKAHKEKESGCDVVGEEKRSKIFDRVKAIGKEPKLYLAIAGVVALAFSVNLIEMVCSAGLPALFSQVLAMNNLSGTASFLYLLLYDFFFMIDDLIVFFAALITMRLTGVSTKYGRTAKIIGGIVMLTIGLLLIFKPEWLMFG